MKAQRSDNSKGLLLARKGVACCTPTSFPSSLAVDYYSLVWWDLQPQEIVTTLSKAYSSPCSLSLPFIERRRGVLGHRPVSQEPRTAGNGFLGEGSFGGLQSRSGEVQCNTLNLSCLPLLSFSSLP